MEGVYVLHAPVNTTNNPTKNDPAPEFRLTEPQQESLFKGATASAVVAGIS